MDPISYADIISCSKQDPSSWEHIVQYYQGDRQIVWHSSFSHCDVRVLLLMLANGYIDINSLTHYHIRMITKIDNQKMQHSTTVTHADFLQYLSNNSLEILSEKALQENHTELLYSLIKTGRLSLDSRVDMYKKCMFYGRSLAAMLIRVSIKDSSSIQRLKKIDEHARSLDIAGDSIPLPSSSTWYVGSNTYGRTSRRDKRKEYFNKYDLHDDYYPKA